jgi:hypothetical protein
MFWAMAMIHDLSRATSLNLVLSRFPAFLFSFAIFPSFFATFASTPLMPATGRRREKTLTSAVRSSRRGSYTQRLTRFLPVVLAR